MLWGYNQIDEFKNTVKAGYSTHVLGMNEYVVSHHAALGILHLEPD